MKIVLAWLAAVALALISASSCSINHRSGDYECTRQTDCESGRQCLNGYCVVPGGAIDAPKPVDARKTDAAIDAPMNLCPPQCTSCNPGTMTCNIDCGQTNCTGNAAIVCPSGWNCAINCSTQNSCQNGINCNAAASCAITCGGQSSCRGIECGTGDCDVKCNGQGACRDIDCGNSCACDVGCSINSACELLTCSSTQCDPIGRGCTSMGLGCDTCP